MLYTDSLRCVISTSQMPINAVEIIPVGYNLKVSHLRHFYHIKVQNQPAVRFWTVPKYDIPYQVSAFH